MWDALFSGIDWIYTGPIAIGYAVSWLFLILGKSTSDCLASLKERLKRCFSTRLDWRPAWLCFGLDCI